ncbi:MAG: hypothetical protein H7263_18245, partial [Candidatus Sericytochromatia bacterium]|nr:hypothetical protein [Candidatus Sericytochromatia bacterium]
MNVVLNKIFNESISEYPTEQDQKELIKYCKTVDFRFKVLREIEAKEEEIIKKCVDNMLINYPSMNQYTHVKEKTFRDMSIVLRYCCQSMIQDDPDFLKDQLLFWFRTIIQSFGFERGVIRDTYKYMDEC